METEQRTRHPEDRPMVGRSRRRLLVVAVYLVYAASAAAWVLLGGSSSSQGGWRSLSFLVFLLAAVLVGTLVLRRSSRKTAELANEQADERQRAVRDRAHRLAYRIVLNVLLVAIVYLSLHESGQGWTDRLLWVPDSVYEAWGLVWGLFLLVASLPSAIVAWTEPDPPPGDEV